MLSQDYLVSENVHWLGAEGKTKMETNSNLFAIRYGLHWPSVMEERKDSDCSSLVWSISLCNIRYIRLVDAGAAKWLFTWSPQMAKLATGYCHKLSWSSLMPWSSSGRKLDDGRKLWFTLQNSSIRLTRQYIPPHFDLSLNWHSPYFFMDYLRVLPLSPIWFFFFGIRKLPHLDKRVDLRS